MAMFEPTGSSSTPIAERQTLSLIFRGDYDGRQNETVLNCGLHVIKPQNKNSTSITARLYVK